MLKIRVIVVDRSRAPFIKAGESFYLERLKKYVQAEWVEVKPTKIKKGRSLEEILTTEGKKISQKLAIGDYLVTLDRSGHEHDSVSLAAWLNKLSIGVWSRVSFIIGGPLGLSREILERSQEVLSLSNLTLTHEMSRLLLLEQLYRAFTILSGEKYHK
jgi:23S rRNA (pseudouridine1915-N3)-methyltransferase